MPIEFAAIPSMIIAILTLFVGQGLVNWIAPLRQYNIPVPVVGGLVFALVFAGLQTQTTLRLSFDTELRSLLMLAFFTGVGLTADLARLKQGGIKLAIFLVIVVVFLILQNSVSAAVAWLLDLHPGVGLLTGSVTLSGGHGTGAAWAERFVQIQNLAGALELAVASATFGLVIGGLIGGPVCQVLVTRYQLSPTPEVQGTDPLANEETAAVGVVGVLATLLLMLLGVIAGQALFALFADAAVKLPSFIWALFVGILLRNSLELLGLYRVDERALELLSTLALWLALAFTFMGLRLWELLDLAGPLLLILAAQTIAIVLFAALVTFRMLGANYDAAVMAAGQCGFCMGATPTAIANMQAVTARYGASPLAFIVVPMIGAFFIDIVNALVIQGFLMLPFHGF